MIYAFILSHPSWTSHTLLIYGTQSAPWVSQSLTMAEPTMTPSAWETIFLACSGVEIPKPYASWDVFLGFDEFHHGSDVCGDLASHAVTPRRIRSRQILLPLLRSWRFSRGRSVRSERSDPDHTSLQRMRTLLFLQMGHRRSILRPFQLLLLSCRNAQSHRKKQRSHRS